MKKIETRIIKKEVAQHLMNKNSFKKCVFLYFKESEENEHRFIQEYDSIVMIDDYKLEKVLIMVLGDCVSVNEIPLTIEILDNVYSEIKILNP